MVESLFQYRQAIILSIASFMLDVLCPMVRIEYRLQEALVALRAQSRLSEANYRFLKWYIGNTENALLEKTCDGLEDDALLQALIDQAADKEFGPDDWEVLLFTSVIFPVPLTHVSINFQRLSEAGCRNPLQTCVRADDLVDLLDGDEQLARKIGHRCEYYFACGVSITLREALQTPPEGPCIPSHQWKPDSWKLTGTPGSSVLPMPVKLWECCDADIRECMKTIPNTKCMFPRRRPWLDCQGASNSHSAERSWCLAPTQAVNAALRLLAYRNRQQEAYQWRSTKRIYSQKIPSDAEAVFVLQQGADGDIVSAYGMAMWDQLMWDGDNKNDMPEYTTHPTTVYCGRGIYRHVAALDLVKICNSPGNFDNRVQSVSCTILTRVIHLCVHCRIPVVLFGNMFYTWAAKVVDGQLLVSRPYPYCDSGDGKLTVGEVAYMVSYTAMQARGCEPWPLEVAPAPAPDQATA